MLIPFIFLLGYHIGFLLNKLSYSYHLIKPWHRNLWLKDVENPLKLSEFGKIYYNQIKDCKGLCPKIGSYKPRLQSL